VSLRAPTAVAALLLLAAATLDCGSSNLASNGVAPPPFDPKGQTKCGVTRSQSKPLVVEWPSADRAQLESTAHRGLVVVHYEGCELEVLDNCSAPASYGYAAITRKKDRIQLRNADDLYANMPVGAAGLEAKLAQSGELDVDMTIVGRWEARRGDLRTNDLAGSCAKATHVVNALTVGAFEFTAGASASVGGGVKGLGMGAGASSKSSRETINADGDKEACEKATSGDAKPPEGCGAVLRVELTPLGEPTCRLPWLAWSGSACARKAPPGPSASRHTCKDTDTVDCARQCEIGDAASCNSLTWSYWNATNGVQKDEALAFAYAEIGCADGFNASCGNLGRALSEGLGSGKDPPKGLPLMSRACDGGDYMSCVWLGLDYKNGTGVQPDGARALALEKRACDLHSCAGCWNAGLWYYDGTGGGKDLVAARAAFEASCKEPVPGAMLGWMLHRGEGGPRDDARAEKLLRDACSGGNQDGCVKLKAMLDENAAANAPAAPAPPLTPERARQMNQQLSQQIQQISNVVQELRQTLITCTSSSKTNFLAELDAEKKNLDGYRAQLTHLTPPAAGAAQHAASDVIMRDLGARIDELGDQVRRSHTRLALLSDTISSACPKKK
jgi:TPR repeat protein